MSRWIKDIFTADRRPAHILFRVDGGRVRGLSFGHLVRCAILAEKCRLYFNAESTFLMKDYPEGVDYIEKKEGLRVRTIPVDIPLQLEKKAVFDVLKELRIDTLVYDVPAFDMDGGYLPGVKDNGIYTVFIDDVQFISPAVDAILNSHIQAQEKTLQRPGIQYFLGASHFLIDEEQIDREVGKTRTAGDTVEILLTFGGSDPAGLTYRVLDALTGNSLENTGVKVILGPGYRDGEKLQRLIDEKAGAEVFTLLHAPENIYQYFPACDLVICAGGRTLYELNYLKVPAFPIAGIRHEADVIRAFYEKGLVEECLLEWNEEAFLKKLNHLLSKIKRMRDIETTNMEV
ncbi:MAG: hypothetical protein GY765_37415 [bacterium]|nr:hypothetical protein [bacterium]